MGDISKMKIEGKEYSIKDPQRHEHQNKDVLDLITKGEHGNLTLDGALHWGVTNGGGIEGFETDETTGDITLFVRFVPNPAIPAGKIKIKQSFDIPESGDVDIPDPPKDNGTYKLHSYRKGDKTVYYWKIEEYNREFFDYNASESGILSYNNMFYYDSLYKISSQDRAFYKSLLFADNGAGTVSVYHPLTGELIKIYTHDKSELLKPHGNSVSIIETNNVPYMYSNIYNTYASQEDKHIGECCVYELFEKVDE